VIEIVTAVRRQRSNQLNYVPNLLFIRLAPNPHVCCLLLLSTISPLSTVSTGSIETGRNGQHGQHVKLASIPPSYSRDPEHLSLLCD
jgi:hypothetical protein